MIFKITPTTPEINLIMKGNNSQTTLNNNNSFEFKIQLKKKGMIYICDNISEILVIGN